MDISYTVRGKLSNQRCQTLAEHLWKQLTSAVVAVSAVLSAAVAHTCKPTAVGVATGGPWGG